MMDDVETIEVLDKLERESEQESRRLRTIRDELVHFPPDFLEELADDLERVASGSFPREENDRVLEDWYHRALSVRATRAKPVDPVMTYDEARALLDLTP
jgi:hypothetical protein